MKLHFITTSILLVVFCLVTLLSSATITNASTCNLPAIFNFGDSNSDTGGLAAAFPPLPPPFGVSFFNTSAGRLSDGRLVIDFIAEHFGLPFLSAYLDSLGSNFSHGVNYATSGSTVVPVTPEAGYSPFHLQVQLAQFLETRNKSHRIYRQEEFFRSLLPKEEYFSKALYTIDIGQNDLTALFESSIPEDTYIPYALQQLSAHITRLYKGGGKYFWIHNTGPLGCLPYVILRMPSTSAQLDSAGCSIFFNKLAQGFNKQLNDTIISLRMQLPKATLVLVDIYSVKYKLFNQSTRLGFENPLSVCCGYGGGEYNYSFDVRCGYPGVINGTERVATVCDNPSKSVIWDGAHYTDAANEFVFEQILSGNFSNPPLGLREICK